MPNELPHMLWRTNATSKKETKYQQKKKVPKAKEKPKPKK
jgi:hypothetical protein